MIQRIPDADREDRTVRTLIIHNPRSGFGSDAIFQFERSLAHAGDECVLRLLDEGFDVKGACSDAGSFDVAVVSGGDGTVTSLLYELRHHDIPVCVFPSGTANLLCSNIGNAPEPSALARACRKGRTTRVDLGEITWEDDRGERHVRGFGIMSGTGFDAQIMQAAIPNKAIMGQAAYFAAAIANPLPPVEHFAITVDGKTIERDGISCLVANNATIQGDIQLVPECRMDDGELDVIVVETRATAQLIGPLAFGFVDRDGKMRVRPFLETLRGRTVRVESSRPVPIEVDGEVEPGLAVAYEARILPSAVRIIVDSMSPYAGEDDGRSRFGGSDIKAYPDA